MKEKSGRDKKISVVTACVKSLLYGALSGGAVFGAFVMASAFLHYPDFFLTGVPVGVLLFLSMGFFFLVLHVTYDRSDKYLLKEDVFQESSLISFEADKFSIVPPEKPIIDPPILEQGAQSEQPGPNQSSHQNPTV